MCSWAPCLFSCVGDPSRWRHGCGCCVISVEHSESGRTGRWHTKPHIHLQRRENWQFWKGMYSEYQIFLSLLTDTLQLVSYRQFWYCGADFPFMLVNYVASHHCSGSVVSMNCVRLLLSAAWQIWTAWSQQRWPTHWLHCWNVLLRAGTKVQVSDFS